MARDGRAKQGRQGKCAACWLFSKIFKNLLSFSLLCLGDREVTTNTHFLCINPYKERTERMPTYREFKMYCGKKDPPMKKLPAKQDCQKLASMTVRQCGAGDTLQSDDRWWGTVFQSERSFELKQMNFSCATVGNFYFLNFIFGNLYEERLTID